MILILSLFFFSASLGEASELKKVKVGSTTGLEMAPLMVAKEMGFYKDAGLDIEILDIPSARDQLPALASGQIDVLRAGSTPGFINMAASGFGGRIVSGYNHSSPAWYGSHINGILVRKDLYDKGEVKTTKDLKGRRVAFPALVRTYIFNVALKSVGLRLEDRRDCQVFRCHGCAQVRRSGCGPLHPALWR
jgi:NitT/TauT family transport system substrate-binding protein